MDALPGRFIIVGLGWGATLRQHQQDPAEAQPRRDLERAFREGAAEFAPFERVERARAQFAARLFEHLAALDPAGLDRRDDELEDLVVELARLGLVDPEALEFVAGEAAAEAEDGPPVRDMVEHDDLLGQPHRIVPGHDDHLGAEPDPPRPPGKVGERLQAGWCRSNNPRNDAR